MRWLVAWSRSVLALLRRHPWSAGFLVLLLVVRVALPAVLRPVLAARSSDTLGGRVEIGDIDLWLLRGAVGLDAVSVFAESPEAPVILSWERLYVRLRWGSVLRGALRLADIALESPHVNLARLEDGGINLLQLLSSDGEEPAEPPPSEGEGGWPILIDRLGLSGGSIRFRDLTVRDTEGVLVDLDRIEVTRLALGGEGEEVPARVTMEARFEEGAVRAKAGLRFLDEGLAIHARVKAENLPAHRTLPYLPEGGVRDARGRLDARIDYWLEPGARDELRGRVALRDLVVEVPDVDRPALGWRALRVDVGSIDLLAGRVVLDTVDVDGASLVLRPAQAPVVPLLGAPSTDVSTAPESPASATSPGESEAAVTSAPPAGATEAVAGSPWHWAVSRLGVQDAHVIVLGEDPPLDIALRASVQDLVSDGGEGAAVDVELRDGEALLTVKGSFRLQPMGFRLDLHWQDLSVPRLLSAAGVELAQVVRTARASGDLAVAAGPDGSETHSAGTVAMQGRLGIADLSLAEEESDAFSVQWDSLDVEVEDVRVPGALPGGGTDAPAVPIAARLGRIHLVGPAVRLTWEAEGFVLPAALSGGEQVESDAAEEGETLPAEEGRAPDDGPRGDDGRGIELQATAFDVEKGQVTFVDRSVSPFFRGTLSEIALQARRVAWPELRVGDLSLDLKGPEGGSVRLTGKVEPADIRLSVKGDRLALRRFNPYATTYSGYSIGKGQASLTSTVRVDKTYYDTKNKVVLHDLSVQGTRGEHLFREQFGVPLSLALALMRDVKGNITLDLPVTGDVGGARVGLFSIVRGALQQAILGSLTSPLKILGAVSLGKGKVEGFVVEPVRFLPGRVLLAPEGKEQVEHVAEVLTKHLGLRVDLEGQVGEADLRWLGEQDLLAELQEGRDVETSQGKSVGRGTRRAIREYLEERSADRPAALGEEEQSVLSDLVDRREISRDRLLSLTVERAGHVRDVLQSEHGIGPNQVRVEASEGEPAQGEPGVSVGLGSGD